MPPRMLPKPRAECYNGRMSTWLAQLVWSLEQSGPLAPEQLAAAREHARQIADATQAEVVELLAALAEIIDRQGANHPAAATEMIGEQLWRRYQSPDPPSPLGSAAIHEIVRIYRGLGPQSTTRHHFLRALAAEASPAALTAFEDLFVSDPPQRADDAALACVPLFQQATPQTATIFPRLLDALQRPETAPLVLDLSNYLTRRRLVDQHPARQRAPELIALLSGLTEGLRRLEENPRQVASTPVELQRRLAESVALVAPLCEALALIGDEAAVGKLYQVLSLGHRRLRVVAASALARLGDSTGSTALVELAAEPVVRSLALASLDELGQTDRVDARYRSGAARAEGDLAEYLAHPARFSLPPAELELIDATRQPWPGHSQPVDCFLFRFEYALPQGEFSGVGIAGPVTHALYADLEDLSPDDIYAVYAGWFAEHEEISETSAEELDSAHQVEWQALQTQLDAQGFQNLRLAKVGHFFGQNLYVAAGRRDGRSGVLILDEDQPHWFPSPPSARPLGTSEFYWLFKGRRILHTFEHRGAD